MNKWYRYQIISSEMTKSFFKFTYDPGGGGAVADGSFAIIRGAIAHATDKSPCYWCLVGQEFVDPTLYVSTADPRFELIGEVEDHGLDADARHQALLDDGALFMADFYCDLSPEYAPIEEAYRSFQDLHKSEFGGLYPAPWAEARHFRLGVESLKSLVRSHKLDIPKKTTAFEQLSRITESDLADPDCRSKYYAIEALRHVMASFKRNPHEQIYLEGPRAAYPGSEGWML